MNPSAGPPWRVLLAAIAMIASCAGTCRADQGRSPDFSGPYELRQFLTFYVVNPSGEDFSIAIRWQNERQAQMDQPMLVRVFDPNEKLLIRHDDPGLRWEGLGPPPQHTIELPIKAAPEGLAGVYQVSIVGFWGFVTFDTSPVLKWGVF